MSRTCICKISWLFSIKNQTKKTNLTPSTQNALVRFCASNRATSHRRNSSDQYDLQVWPELTVYRGPHIQTQYFPSKCYGESLKKERGEVALKLTGTKPSNQISNEKTTADCLPIHIYLKCLSIWVSRMTVNVARFGEMYDATSRLERTKYAMVRSVNIIRIGFGSVHAVY